MTVVGSLFARVCETICTTRETKQSFIESYQSALIQYSCSKSFPQSLNSPSHSARGHSTLSYPAPAAVRVHFHVRVAAAVAADSAATDATNPPVSALHTVSITPTPSPITHPQSQNKVPTYQPHSPSSDSDYSSHPSTETHYTTTTPQPNSAHTRRSSTPGRNTAACTTTPCARSPGCPSAGTRGGCGASRRGAGCGGRHAGSRGGWCGLGSCGCRFGLLRPVFFIRDWGGIGGEGDGGTRMAR